MTTIAKSDSYVSLDDQGRVTSYAGPDATRYAQCRVLVVSLKLWQRAHIKPTRTWSVGAALCLATDFTHKPYARSDRGITAAIADLNEWAAAMRSALPIVRPDSSEGGHL